MTRIEREPLIPPQQVEKSLLYGLRRDSEYFEYEIARALQNGDIDFNVHLYPMAMTLLEIACCEGRAGSIKHLLKRGVDVNRFNNVHNMAPIHFAAKAGHADVLEVLLQNERCKPDLKYENQMALHIAVDNNYADCVKVLLEYDADPNITNSKGLTPMDIAARTSSREIVEVILNVSKFLPNIHDFRDFEYGFRVTTLYILKNKFPDLNCKWFASKQRNCLQVIRETPYYELTRDVLHKLIMDATYENCPLGIRELLNKGRRDLCLPSIPEATKCAVILGYHNVLRELLTFDTKFEDDLLLLACTCLDADEDHIKCFKVIVQQPNINVQCADDKGNIPLHYAARANSIEAVKHLLELGKPYSSDFSTCCGGINGSRSILVILGTNCYRSSMISPSIRRFSNKIKVY